MIPWAGKDVEAALAIVEADAARQGISPVEVARQAVAQVHRDVERGFRNVPVLPFERVLEHLEEAAGVTCYRREKER